MSTPRRPLHPLTRPALGTLLALALTGCGASLDAQTYQERSNADATNTAVGTIDLRGLGVETGGADRTHEVGSDAEVFVFMANQDDEPDTLLEVTSPDAEEVLLLLDGEETDSIEVPGLGRIGGETAALRMVSLTEELREGEYTTLTFRFERAGTIDTPVPVRTSGKTDRPVYTGDGEEEPALQAPAGGHGEEHGEDEEETGAETAGGEE